MPDRSAPIAALVVRDAAAYRTLSRPADVEGARDLGREAAARDRAAGRTPAASPATLWALLAAAAPEPLPEGAKPRRAVAPAGGPTRAAHRAARARAALAACLAHCAPDDPDAAVGAAPDVVRLPLLAPDPDLVLVHGLAGRLTAGAGAWGAYLASLATEVVVEGPVARLAGPLTHVAERARQLEGDVADEIQDAVVAGYDAVGGSEGEAWDDTLDVAARQAAVAAAAAALDDAIAEGRAERVWHLLGGAAAADDVGGAPGTVRELFAPGLTVWREVVRTVIGGEVELTGRRWRETLWGLQLAFTLEAPPPPPTRVPGAENAAPTASAPLALLVTGDPLLRDAARRAGVAAVRSADA